jgi:hypothetical protein
LPVAAATAQGPVLKLETGNLIGKEMHELHPSKMASKAPIDPILERFRVAVKEIYGDRVARLVLFGSRAWRCTTGFRL